MLIDEDEGIVVVKGPQYIDDMAKRYMTSEASIIVQSFKADVPCEEGISALSTTTTRQSVEAASLTRSLVQSLAYAAAKFKPEIIFHVGRLQRFADHIVAPSLCETGLALIHGVNALRHRALAASGCPGPKVCRQCPAIEGCSTRST